MADAIAVDMSKIEIENANKIILESIARFEKSVKTLLQHGCVVRFRVFNGLSDKPMLDSISLGEGDLLVLSTEVYKRV